MVGTFVDFATEVEELLMFGLTIMPGLPQTAEHMCSWSIWQRPPRLLMLRSGWLPFGSPHQALKGAFTIMRFRWRWRSRASSTISTRSVNGCSTAGAGRGASPPDSGVACRGVEPGGLSQRVLTTCRTVNRRWRCVADLSGLGWRKSGSGGAWSGHPARGALWLGEACRVDWAPLVAR